MDSLDVKRFPQFRPGFGRYHKYAIEAMEPLRKALGFEPSWHSIPNASNVAVIPNGRFEQRISVRPQSYVWGFAAYSEQPEGFQAQIYDLGTRAQWFSEPLDFDNFTSAEAPANIGFPLYILPAPRLVLEPGLLSVQVVNMSDAVNTVQLLMLMAQPAPPPQPKNEWNATLDREADIARRAVRNGGAFVPVGGSGGAGTTPAADSTIGAAEIAQYFEASLAGDNVILPGFGSLSIKVLELSLYNSEANDITFWDGTTRKLHGTMLNFPAGGGYFLPPSSRPHWELTPGNSLVINLANATQVSGFVRYRME